MRTFLFKSWMSLEFFQLFFSTLVEIVWIIRMIFFILFIQRMTQIHLKMSNQPSISYKNHTWLTCLTLHTYCCIWLTNILLEFLHLCSQRKLMYNFLSFLLLGIRVILTLYYESGSVPSSSISSKVFVRLIWFFS